jgi:dolichyl-phosphate-mannose-protein mannosyltransferase
LDVEVRNNLLHIYRWEYFWLCLFVIATLAMHFVIINQVKDPILDEAHYAGYYGSTHTPINGDAYSIIHDHKDMRPEHPPLGKLFIVAGIDGLGDNPWGWRVPSIIMGTIGIILFFFVCRSLNMSRRAVNIATFLFAFENFTFLMASVAMLDVFFMTLTLAFFLLYLNRQYVMSGLFIGLAATAKLYAALATPALAIHWLFTKTKQTRWFLLTVFFAIVSFIAFMPLFDFVISRSFQNPLGRIKEMLTLSASLTFANTTHPALSRPWEWLLSYRPMAFWYVPHYTGAISPSVWGTMIPVVLYMIYRTVRQRNDAALFGFAWFFSTYVLWIPISVFTNRVSFIYYFYPSIGALCLGLGLGLNEAREWVSSRQMKVKVPVMAGIVAFLLFHAASFIYLTPVFIHTGY